MILAIGGVSNAGKSTLATEIQDVLPEKKISIICQDDFIADEKFFPMINGRPDWEHPESIDHEKFMHSITWHHKQDNLVIAEGLLVFHHPETLRMFDKGIFIEIERHTFLQRKNNDFRWGPQPDWYLRHIWESYMKHGQAENCSFPLLRIRGDQPFDMTAIRQFILYGTVD
jgi:uridine kinase